MNQYGEILERESILCPQEVSLDVGSKLTDLKMSYLVTEKADLEIELIELKQNNDMLRKINSQISIQEPIDVGILLGRNQELQQSICKLGKQVKRVRAELFLVNQISAQDENEQRQIYKNYEDKILELRRAVHDKETSIQELESKISGKNKKETFAIPQKSALDYCELVSQARQKLKEAQKENHALKEQTKILKQENSKLSNRLTKIESLLKSKYSFIDFRNRMNEKSSRSNPKQQSKGFEHNKEHSTLLPKGVEKQNFSLCCREHKDSFLCLTRQDITVIGKVIEVVRKKMIIIENLEHRNRNLVKANQIYVAELSKLRNSNQFYQKERKRTYEKANLFKITASRVLNYLSKRESSQHLFEKAYQYQDKDNQLKLLANQLKAPSPILLPVAFLKTEWQNQKSLLEQKIKCFKAYKKQRSYSCIIDYIRCIDLTLAQQNVLEKDPNLVDPENGLLLNEDQEKEFEPIQSMAKRKRGKLNESFSIFANVLLDL